MSKSKNYKEAIKTRVLLLLLEGIRNLMTIDKELHAINILIILKENPDLGKSGQFILNIKNSVK